MMGAMTEDLVAFLRARLTEDERTARATVWDGSGNRLDWYLPASATVDVGGDDFGAGDRTVANHIARHDPARVLAEVDAKRRLIDASAADCAPGCIPDHMFTASCALRWMGPAWEEAGSRWVHDAAGATTPAPPATSDYALRLLALPYRDHPDYQPEWALTD